MTRPSLTEEATKGIRPSRLALFAAFFKIGILGFGGVAAWARHVLVTERRFLNERDFAESFGLASTLPGANTVNLATMLGDRYRGLSGALVAVLGLMGAPVALLAGIAWLYERYGSLPDVRAALYGAAAAAAGLVLGTSLKILRDLEPDAANIASAAGVCCAAFANIAMPLILLVAVPASILAGLWKARRT